MLLPFSVGAYQEWRETDRTIGEILLPSYEATLQQLRGERGRANAWLGTLRGSREDRDVGVIEHIFDTFWLQTLERLVKPRAPSLWDSFSIPDHAAGELEDIPADERERVFRKVRDAVARLDVVIAEYEATQRGVKEMLAK